MISSLPPVDTSQGATCRQQCLAGSLGCLCQRPFVSQLVILALVPLNVTVLLKLKSRMAQGFLPRLTFTWPVNLDAEVTVFLSERLARESGRLFMGR